MSAGQERLPKPYATNVRKGILEIIRTAHAGSRSSFVNKTGVNEKSLERWLAPSNEAQSPSLVAIVRIGLAEDVSLDWLLFRRGRKNAPKRTVGGVNAQKLWENAEGLVTLPRNVARDEVHYLMPSPTELARSVVAACDAYVSRMYSLVRVFVDEGVPLSQLFLSRKLRTSRLKEPVTILLRNPLESEE